MQPLRIRKFANGYLYSASTFGGPVNGIVPMGTAQWVGGTLEVTEDLLWFGANMINRVAVGDVSEVHIPTADIVSVEYRFGWFTGIVVVRHVHGEFTLRCYGAKNLVATLHMLFVAPKDKWAHEAEYGEPEPAPAPGRSRAGARPVPGRRN
ncbi:hypothetical protein [Pseudomonas putida]|uniref:Uncharacterized protein n=1 Tax=Pseudomonas putida TaxID=303 RepID=A0A1Q9R314_PSEPU|nr:hypothetical protein [Pseudomonas putida]OLS61768.1 hypothetical protein PSEMO_33120 [Pseudomonas putida]